MAAAPIDEYFERVYTREDASAIKPDPEIYLRAMRELGLSPAECAVVEDSLVGVEAAKAAGIETAAVYDRYSDGEREEIRAAADVYVQNFDELSAMI